MVPGRVHWRPCEDCAGGGSHEGEWIAGCERCEGPAPRPPPAEDVLAASSVVVKVATSVRPTRASEDALQVAVAEALEAARARGELAAEVTREARLEDERGRSVGRIDFLVGEVGLELKVAGFRSEVIRQVAGYARSSRIALIVLASTRAALLTDWPDTLVGKPIVLVHLRRFP